MSTDIPIIILWFVIIALWFSVFWGPEVVAYWRMKRYKPSKTERVVRALIRDGVNEDMINTCLGISTAEWISWRFESPSRSLFVEKCFSDHEKQRHSPEAVDRKILRNNYKHDD